MSEQLLPVKETSFTRPFRLKIIITSTRSSKLSSDKVRKRDSPSQGVKKLPLSGIDVEESAGTTKRKRKGSIPKRKCSENKSAPILEQRKQADKVGTC